ncbi:hypothetical protein [Crossiella sp. NPDC003009]
MVSSSLSRVVAGSTPSIRVRAVSKSPRRMECSAMLASAWYRAVIAPAAEASSLACSSRSSAPVRSASSLPSRIRVWISQIGSWCRTATARARSRQAVPSSGSRCRVIAPSSCQAWQATTGSGTDSATSAACRPSRSAVASWPGPGMSRARCAATTSIGAVSSAAGSGPSSARAASTWVIPSAERPATAAAQPSRVCSCARRRGSRPPTWSRMATESSARSTSPASASALTSSSSAVARLAASSCRSSSHAWSSSATAEPAAPWARARLPTSV